MQRDTERRKFLIKISDALGGVNIEIEIKGQKSKRLRYGPARDKMLVEKIKRETNPVRDEMLTYSKFFKQKPRGGLIKYLRCDLITRRTKGLTCALQDQAPTTQYILQWWSLCCSG